VENWSHGGAEWMNYRSNLAPIIASVVLALVGSVAVTGLLSASRTIGSTGTVKTINVEAHWDLEGTQVVDQIDWGILEPGQSVDKTIYVENAGNAALSLAMTYSGWVPLEAGNYITLSWDKEGATVNSGETIGAVLTLTVSSSTSGITSFSFDIIIEGSG